MAIKDKAAGYREIMTAINRGIFAPFYLLMGEEDYYIDSITAALEDKVVSPDERDFDLVTFYGADSDIGRVIGAAQRFPVMAPRQLVMLKEAQAMINAKSNLEKLASYLNNPNMSTVLVVTYKGEALPSTSALMKKLKDSPSIAFKSDKLRDYQLSDPIKDYCSSKKINIDEKAVAMLCDYIGSPLSKLFGEIDKIIISEGKGLKKITPDQIEKNIGISKDFNTFELVKAMGRKDYERSMRIVKYFASNPKQNPGVMIVSTLFNFYSKLLLAAMVREKTDANLMAELDLKNSYALKDYKEALGYYNARSAMAAVHFIREHDAKSKGINSYQNEYDLLRELVFNIISFR